ncbi:hypothetical protein Q8A67_002417 [Cirrhinus molitorella]|uniref:Uncharacterized protein n=1 Tax=Cirrhinus molitorella TaxID=172907 RepID=A0AA88TWT1_9TELE|nr:hypothetical protein Q8A67_002417 [Cirrhinus molitorella]
MKCFKNGVITPDSSYKALPLGGGGEQLKEVMGMPPVRPLIDHVCSCPFICSLAGFDWPRGLYTVHPNRSPDSASDQRAGYPRLGKSFTLRDRASGCTELESTAASNPATLRHCSDSPGYF